MHIWSSGRVSEAMDSHLVPGHTRLRMFAAQDPLLRSEGVLEICLGFLNATELRTDDGIHHYCCQCHGFFQTELCFADGNGLGCGLVSLLIPTKVNEYICDFL